MHIRPLLAALLVGAALGAACHGGDSPTSADVIRDLASCASATRPFTVPPQDLSMVAGWVPLGNLNPPGHTFPTDHQYIYLTSFGTGSPSPIALVAPGDLTVTQAKVTRYSSGLVAEDYAVTFSPCQEIRGEFGHVRTLSPALQQQLGPIDQGCNSYSPDAKVTVTQCYSRTIAGKLKAGDAMGTSAGLDFSLFDTRVPAAQFANNARWAAVNSSGFDRFHVVPASDYFEEPARSAVRALLGAFDGRVKRSIEPVGGTIATDVAGTAQGTWVNPSQPTYPESPHLAIVPDNIEPNVIDVSVGLSQPGLSSGTYRMLPAVGGTIDRHPAQVTVGSGIHCYDLHYYFGVGHPAALLLQLVDANTLKVEALPGDAATCPSIAARAFTTAAFTYVR